LVLVSAPHRGHRIVHTLHATLKSGIADLLAEVLGEGNLKILLAHLDACEAELQLDVLIVDINEILDRLVDDFKGVLHDINAHLASIGDGHGVRVHHLEALHVDAFLATGRRDFLLALIAVKKALKDGVDHEARLQFVNVLALATILSDV